MSVCHSRAAVAPQGPKARLRATASQQLTLTQPSATKVSCREQTRPRLASPRVVSRALIQAELCSRAHQTSRRRRLVPSFSPRAYSLAASDVMSARPNEN